MKVFLGNLLSFFSFIDLFAFSPSVMLTYKKKYKYSNPATILITIFAIMFALWAFFYFSSNMLYRTNPYVSMSESFASVSSYEGTERDFYCVILVQKTDFTHFFVNESIYTIKAFLNSYENNSLVNSTELEVFYDESKGYCIKDRSKVQLKEIDFDTMIKLLKISMVPCNNETYNNACLSNEQIMNSIVDCNVQTSFPFSNVDPQNVNNPFFKKYAVDYNQLPNNKTSYFYYIFDKMNVWTDNGNIFQNYENSGESISLHDKRKITDSYIDEFSSFCNVYFSLSGSRRQYFRSFDKIQGIFAQIGGLLNGFILLMNLIVTSLVKRFFLYKMVLETLDNEENSKLNLKENTIINSNLSKEPHIKNSKTSFFKYMKSSIWQKKNKKEIEFFKNIQELKDNLDLYNIIQKLLIIKTSFLKSESNGFKKYGSITKEFKSEIPNVNVNRKSTENEERICGKIAEENPPNHIR